MTAQPIGDVLELTIERVAHGGVCVAHEGDDAHGRVVFVRHALPGERVRAVVTEDHGQYLRADAVEILRPSTDRVAPPCPYAGSGLCGGCDWQHASMAAQREMKALVIREQYSRITHLLVHVEVEALPDVDSARGPGLGWRTRVELGVDPDGAVGFHRHRSHELQPIDDCLIAHELVDVPALAARRWPRAGRVEVTAAVGTGERAVAVVPRKRGKSRRDRADVRELALGRSWRVTGAGFWQVHPAAAETLATAVLDAAQVRPGDVVLDLYAGVGLFAGALAGQVGAEGRVVAIEGNATAARDAQHNLRDFGKQVWVEAGRVDALLPRYADSKVDVIVLDPPRTGAGRDVMVAMCELAPRRIVYVSCDPATLARDVRYAYKNGWQQTALRAFDLFPMTGHVECVATLEPKVEE